MRETIKIATSMSAYGPVAAAIFNLQGFVPIMETISIFKGCCCLCIWTLKITLGFKMQLNPWQQRLQVWTELWSLLNTRNCNRDEYLLLNTDFDKYPLTSACIDLAWSSCLFVTNPLCKFVSQSKVRCVSVYFSSWVPWTIYLWSCGKMSLDKIIFLLLLKLKVTSKLGKFDVMFLAYNNAMVVWLALRTRGDIFVQ